uniref:Secreted protein n=1 Tax=Physcomitrium patens TaxID=3218 RepID=A0A2K1JE77_PHYPA|nr:hypothetical protein PHYPA_020116 [Physcomitrium patens]
MGPGILLGGWFLLSVRSLCSSEFAPVIEFIGGSRPNWSSQVFRSWQFIVIVTCYSSIVLTTMCCLLQRQKGICMMRS